MKIDKDWLSYVLVPIPALLCVGFVSLFQLQNNWPLYVGILLMFVVIGRIHNRFQKLQARVEELEERLSQIDDMPTQGLGTAFTTQRINHTSSSRESGS
jgi:hypothetical protein